MRYEGRRAAPDVEGKVWKFGCHCGGMRHSLRDPLPDLNRYLINATTAQRMDSTQDFDTVRITLCRLVSLVTLLLS